MNDDETRLVEALERHAADLTPAPDGLEAIITRLGIEGPTRVDELDRTRRRRQRRHGVVAGVLAVGMAAAATIFAVTGGIRHDATPDPAKTPTTHTTGGVTYADPPRPLVAREVYRIGGPPASPTLYAEYVRNVAPYAPRQSLDALFATAPVDQDLTTLPGQSRNTVASTQETDAALVVDMSAVDTVDRASRSVAAVWVQSWVWTIQTAYSSDKPVLITLNGRPTTLYGSVDTSQPIVRDTRITPRAPYEIFLPREGEQVTSPIDLASVTPDGDYTWTVQNLDTKAVADTPGEGGVGGFSSIGSIELAPGRYRATKQSDPGTKTPGFRRSVTFTVTGEATPAPTRTPVTEPATTALALTPVYFPAEKGGLIEQWRPRSTAGAAVQAMFDGPADPERTTTTWRGTRVRSVSEDGDQVVVDLTLPTGMSGRVDAGTGDAVVATASGFYGRERAVLLRFDKRVVTLPPASGAARDPKVSQPAGPWLPASDTTVSSPVAIVGGVPDPRTTVTWYIADGITNETLYQGTTAVDAADRTYGFGLDLPAGRYNLDLETVSGTGKRLGTFVAFTVS